VKALVTGSRGFAGRHLAQSLTDAGHDVSGLHGDVRDYDQVRHVVRSAEPGLVFHLAAVSSPAEALADPRRAVDVNVTGTLNVLEAVRICAPGARILVAGSGDEYGPAALGEVLTEASACHPRGPYGATKLAATALAMAYAQNHRMQVAVTRAFMHAGPGQRPSSLVARLAREVVAVERGEITHVTHPGLSAAVDLTDVRDVAAAYQIAIAQPAGIYNVCQGAQVTVGRIVTILSRLSEAGRVPLREDPQPWRGENPPASCEPLTAAGWKPQIPLKATLSDLLTYWRRL
jgi:GDP-4-dehydro-6-deoxy-D-mannose reductase